MKNKNLETIKHYWKVFSGEPEMEKEKVSVRNFKKEFIKTFDNISYSHSRFELWSDFVTMFACALSNATDRSHYEKREKTYLNIVKKYTKQELERFPELVALTVLALDDNPEQDFLGDIFMSLNLGNKLSGQFFTPYDICKFMSQITLDNISEKIKEKGYIEICDPCCGSGAMLIAGINESKQQLEKIDMNFQNYVMFVGQDIDMTAALMCYIQISLLGVAGYIKVGNTLTDPIKENDDLENYWFTPMYFSDIWRLRRIFN